MAWQTLKGYVQKWQYQMFYFFFYAGYMPLLLYLPVYLKHVGLSAAYVGVLNGIRPILQSLATPLLVIMAEKLHSRKLLFVASCLIMIGKILVMYLVIHPQTHLCIISYIRESDDAATHSGDIVNKSLSVPQQSPDKDKLIVTRLAITMGGKRRHISTKYVDLLGNATRQPSVVSDHEIDGNNVEASRLTRVNHIALLFRSSEWVGRSKLGERNILDKTGKQYTTLINQNSVYRVFLSLVILTFLADPFAAAIFTLVDYSCVAANEDNRQYQEIRLWETIGWGVMTPIIGFVIYALSVEICGRIIEEFHYVFFFCLAFISVALLVGAQFDFSEKSKEVHSTKIQSTQSNLQYGMFSLMSAFVGFSHGFLFIFVNWFIESLGGNSAIMGLATASKSVVDVALFLLMGKIIEKVGHALCVGVGLVGHVVVFLVYYEIKNPWIVILWEAIYGVVYGLVMSTCASFLVYAAPAGSSFRMQAIFQGICWGVGAGLGSFLAGYRLQKVGFPSTFLTFACITGVVTFIFLAIEALMYFREDAEFDDLSTYDENSEQEEWTSSSTFGGDKSGLHSW